MRSVMKAVMILALAVLAILGVTWISQRRLIYFPTQLPRETTAVPLHMAEVTYPTEDDLSLAAWFAPAQGDPNGVTVVVLPGNAGNRSDRVPLARVLNERGFAVLLVDYRGYGGNPGQPSESGLAADARAAVDYLRTRADVDPDRLVVFGESLGAAVAVELALHRSPTALVLRSPFTSLSDVGSVHYPFLPVSLLLWDEYPNLETISKVESPVLIVAGSADRTVPLEQSRKLFEATPGIKRFVVIDGADHNDVALTAGRQLADEIVAFLDDISPHR